MTPEDHKALVAVTKSLQSTTTITALLNERCTKVLITNEGTQDVKVECLRRMMWNGTVLGHRTKLKAVIHFTKTCTHERHVFFKCLMPGLLFFHQKINSVGVKLHITCW